jgi:hypothetical protein
VTFDDYPCKVISPGVVLDHRLDGEDLAWVRDHLRRCEACRERVDQERLRREREAEEAISAVRRSRLATVTLPRKRRREISVWARDNAASLVASVRVRVSAPRLPLARSRWLAVVALMAALVGGFFVWSGPRLAADAVKPSPASSARIAPVEATTPSAVPSPSATLEPTTLPATSRDGTEPAAAAPASHPSGAPTPAPTPATTAAVPPSVRLTVTPASGLAPLAVTANAAGSTSASGIVSYEFDFGDGSLHYFSPLAQHRYCLPGRYKLTVVVTDAMGLSSSAYWLIYVTQAVPPVSC